MGDDGHLYFIDTIIFKSGTGGQETYNSLSPRASKSSLMTSRNLVGREP